MYPTNSTQFAPVHRAVSVESCTPLQQSVDTLRDSESAITDPGWQESDFGGVKDRQNLENRTREPSYFNTFPELHNLETAQRSSRAIVRDMLSKYVAIRRR